MAEFGSDDAIGGYVLGCLVAGKGIDAKSHAFLIVCERFRKALALLPPDCLQLFVSLERDLTVIMESAPPIPMGMRTESSGPPAARKYRIVLYEEHAGQPEDLFLGEFLRQLGHVVGRRPPESEWPSSRAERARFKASMEAHADALVWKWGLRHYSMIHITAAYPSHWVDTIVAEIEQLLAESEIGCKG